jgi:hypothetical protein
MKREMMTHRCPMEPCGKSVEWPRVFGMPPKGWAWLDDWGPGVPTGMYCEEHAEALNQMVISGELPAIQAEGE